MKRILEEYSWILIVIILLTTLIGGSVSAKGDFKQNIINILQTVVDNKGINNPSEKLIGDAYAVYDDLAETLYFVRSETPIEVDTTFVASDGTEIYAYEVYSDIETTLYSADMKNHEYNYPGWMEGGEPVFWFKSAKFIDVIRPVSTSCWFMCYEGMELDLSKLDTSNVQNMTNMFSVATLLEYLDLSHFDVNKVKDMSYMFDACYSLKGLNLDGWDTSNVEKMDCMFLGTGEYVDTFKLDLSHWNVDKVVSHEEFNLSVEDKITPPNWIN